MKIETDVPLSRFTTFGTGGPASALVRLETAAELEEAIAWAAERGLALLPIGFGSNMLVADEGVEALALRLQGELAEIRIEGEGLIAGAGAPNGACALLAREAGLRGLEFAASIPGTIGGGVAMNAGAWGSCFGNVLVRALIVDGEGSRWLEPGELGLRYRGSDLGSGRIVAAVELALERSTPEAIKAETLRLRGERKGGQPTGVRTFGSVFKNPEHELSAGRMLDACGLRGHEIGGARISPEHANFIENTGKATSADAVALMNEARRRAHERYAVVLEPEVRLVGPIELDRL
jgi:UDP-N-acetylmuramate dehydrogenase